MYYFNQVNITLPKTYIEILEESQTKFANNFWGINIPNKFMGYKISNIFNFH